MNLVNQYLTQYLKYCKEQKRLNTKTIKAYSIDLCQFQSYIKKKELSKQLITDYIMFLHRQFKPKTVKRKIASIKAFFNFLEFEEIIEKNPLCKIQIKFQEPKMLPKIIPQSLIKQLLKFLYAEIDTCEEESNKKQNTLRDICVLELLFATGMRISELCNLSPNDFDWEKNQIRIYGKGDKERIIQICNDDIVKLLQQYRRLYIQDISHTGYFFINRRHKRLSEQSVRIMISKCGQKINAPIHITPHMFRHTFATSLLEENVDIRYIQRMLGHSSITTTEIYTHVMNTKQNELLKTRHPRNKMYFSD